MELVSMVLSGMAVSAVIALIAARYIRAGSGSVEDRPPIGWETVQRLYGEQADQIKAIQLEIDGIVRKMDGDSKRVKSLMGSVSRIKDRLNEGAEVDEVLVLPDPDQSELPLNDRPRPRKRSKFM